MNKSRSIAKLHFLSVALTLFCLAVAVATAWILLEHRRFHSESRLIEAELIENRKQAVKAQVDHVVDHVRYERSLVEGRLRSEVRTWVDQAHAVAEHLYGRYKDARSLDEIKTMARESLRPVRFLDGAGYFFATDMNGVEQLFADRPEMEGKQLIGMTDTEGRPVIRDMIRIAREQGEGFYRYRWTKPGAEGRSFEKVSFIKRFEPFDWFIGAGLYVEDMEAIVRREALERVRQIRFGQDGFVFVLDDEGTVLAHPDPVFMSRRLLDAEARPYHGIIGTILERARNGGESFVSYRMPEDESARAGHEKIGYVRRLDEWGWTIGAGFYIDDIEQMLTFKQHELRNRITLQTALVLALFVLALVLALWAARNFSRKLAAEFDVFLFFFKRAEVDSRPVDLDAFRFDELRRLGRSVNELLAHRSRIEAELARLAMAVEQADEAIVITDADGAIQYVNPAFERVTGYTREEARGQNPRILKSDRHDDAFYRDMWKTLQRGESWIGRMVNKRKDGAFFHEQATISPIRDADGRVTNYVAVKRNITAEVRLETQLRQSQKLEALGNLAGGIAHDFNNILGAILGFTELIREDVPPDTIVASNVEEIYRAGERARDLVRQILMFSRQIEEERRPVQVAMIVKEAMKLLRATLPRTIETRLDLESREAREARVLADPTQIHQVIMNLGANAYHAMREHGGVLEVALRVVSVDSVFEDSAPIALEKREYVELAIADTGCGMDAETVHRIFEPYFTTKAVGEGTGMGLAVVHGIVTSSGGQISVESVPGEGTCFRVYLPLADTLGSEAVEQEATGPEGGAERLLVVDDEETIVRFATQMLERLGYCVTGETDPAKALERVRDNPDEFDLVVSDQTMPGMTGDALTRNLRELRPDLPVILMSGFSETMNAESAREAGAACYLAKPFNQRDLTTAIRAILDADPASAEAGDGD